MQLQLAVDSDEQAATTWWHQVHQNPSAQGHLRASSFSSGMAVTAVPAGYSAPSPSPRPKSPVTRLFLPSSSRQSDLTTESHSSKAAGQLSNTIASIGGRARTLSTDSYSKNFIPSGAHDQPDGVAESSFGIDADPFATHPGDASTRIPQLAANPSSWTLPHPTADIPNHRKQRGSLLFAASDALGFGRVGASISKRMSRRTSVNTSINSPVPQTPPIPQPRRGLPWKGKGKPKGHWALQPPTSTQITSDVIEISAAKSGLITVRDDEEENERKERERLREAAAESIGISTLFREDASSRLTASDGVQAEDESTEDVDSRSHETHLDNDPAERLRALDRSRTSINGSAIQATLPLLQQTRESRHYRSSSLSGIATPTTPSAASNWPLPPLGPPNISANGRTPKGSATESLVQPELPAFPCVFSALIPLSTKSSSVLKFYPTSPLLILGFSRQWRSRVLVLTAPPRPRSPSLSGFRPFTPPERTPSVCHLHLFKSSAADEREVERLEVNANSVVFVPEEEVAGKRSIIKVGGLDVGARKKELNQEENEQTMWLLSVADANEAQNWITTLKNTVLDQRAEKAGFGMATHSSTTSGPRGDLDVMLSMRAQDTVSTVRRYAQNSSRTIHEESRTDSPTPTVKSWSGERRSSSPSGRMVSLKGLFSVPGRVRSMSHATNQSESDSPTTPIDAPSFASRGTTLLNMIRTPNGNNASGTVETDTKSAPSSPIAASRGLPMPIAYPGPILSTSQIDFDRASSKERDREIPEWYSLQNRQRNRGDSTSTSSLLSGPALLPPPRSRRPWTSAGLLNGNAKREQAMDSSAPSRRSFQSAISLHGARLSLDGKTRSSSPVDSLGTTNGALGARELGSKRASLSSSISSFVSSPPENRDPVTARPSSSIQRRIRSGRVPKMLTPPAGPPPSVPADQTQFVLTSSSYGDPDIQSAGDQSLSRTSSLRSNSNSDLIQNGVSPTARRLSASSALSAGSMGTRSSNYNSLRKASNTLSPKRTSIPPPPRPAPTSALPPTPPEVNIPKQNGTPPRRTSFRESLSHRSLRFSLSPPPSKNGSPQVSDAFRRRSLSNGSSVPSVSSSLAPSITVAPPAPPPTGPLPPTPRDPVPYRYSIRERLRMKSAPSSPPTTLPGSPPLLTVSSVASLKDNSTHSIPIGEPITAIPKDLNFLNMSSPIEPPIPPADDAADFLNMSSPLTSSFPKQIPGRLSDYPLPEHANGSPPTPEMTALPPPPRRGRNGTISEKDRDRSSQPLTDEIPLASRDAPPSFPLEPVATV